MTQEHIEREISAAIREKADYHHAPATLAGELLAMADDEEARAPKSARRPAWHGWLRQGFAYAGVAALSCGLTVAVLRPAEEERRADEILATHVGATLARRLLEVASSDHHTVKPWLSARLPYSPPVEDHSAQGYVLAGARLDRVRGQPVAVLVYKRRDHVIDAYVWPAHEAPASQAELSRDGFQLARFSAGGWNWWLVSDLNRAELGDLARLLQRDG